VSGVSLIYLALLGIGIVYAVIILIGGGFADMDGPDLHLGAAGEGAGPHIAPLSPVTIATFITAFGAFGLIALGIFQTTQAWSLAWAAGGAIVAAAVAHFALSYFLLARQGSSEVQTQDIVGAQAEVSTPIPAESVGAVTFVAQGGRLSYPARSADGTPIARGTRVVIEQMSGGVLIVRAPSPTQR
jgi:membrane protein implicated in regulation of membrane protease activity